MAQINAKIASGDPPEGMVGLSSSQVVHYFRLAPERRGSSGPIRAAYDNGGNVPGLLRGEILCTCRGGRPVGASLLFWDAFSVRAAFAHLRVRSEGAEMATASAGRAARVRRRLPRVPRALATRPSRGLGAGQGRRQAHGHTTQLLRSNARSGYTTRHDPEIEELRDKVHCAVVLEQTPPCWKIDRKGKHQTQPQVPTRQGRDPHR